MISHKPLSYAETHHFGGSLQKNPELPKNYVSMTVSFETFLPNKVAHFFFHLVEKRLFARAIDFTFLLEGEQDDELPERALCTTRLRDDPRRSGSRDDGVDIGVGTSPLPRIRASFRFASRRSVSG